MSTDNENIVEIIPIDEIEIINPRDRNDKKFQKIVRNIANIGLKRPITVSNGTKNNGGKMFNLVCGQGRLEAYIALGEERIPAIIKTISREECYIMSLVENLARRRQHTIECVQQIGVLSERGYTFSAIAKKIDTHPEYVKGILHLLKNGEEKLISAVEKEQIPISIALQISTAKDENAQIALLELYESKKLRGRAFTKVRKIIEKRKLQGKSLFGVISKRTRGNYSADLLVRTFKRETERHRILTNNAKNCERRLVFIVTALKKLLEDENYNNLLRAEGLGTMPKHLADEISSKMDNYNG
jgi:ParB family chromosome partitioning protein